MKKTRKPIPESLKINILYKSAYTCCICRDAKAPTEIHHIDQNPSNNIEDNLVVLCRNHHAIAHTKSDLSNNLTPNRLFEAKLQWQKEVEVRSSEAIIKPNTISNSIWTFINHQRLLAVLKVQNISFNEDNLILLQERNVVDRDGIPTFQKPIKTKGHTTIYDRFEWDDAMRLHHLYSEAVNKLILSLPPIELGAIWKKTEIKSIIKPGMLCFCMRGFRFKSGEENNGEEDRTVYAKARGIEIRFIANTRHMFGSSALHCSFRGHQRTAVLFFVKDITNENGILLIQGTPLAMGSGFMSHEYKENTPYKNTYPIHQY